MSHDNNKLFLNVIQLLLNEGKMLPMSKFCLQDDQLCTDNDTYFFYQIKAC